MTRKQAVELYTVLSELRSGAMSREGLTDYILMRLKLKKVYDEFEAARIEISEQTREDDMAAWDAAFRPVMDKWLSEEVEALDVAVLSQKDFIELVSKNELKGLQEDILFQTLVK